MRSQVWKDIEERSRKNHGMVFEACKHFTTLDTAAALVLAAVFRETSVGGAGLFWPLILFGLSLVACAFGMMSTAMRGLEDEKTAISAGTSLILGASVFFFFFFGFIVTVVTILPE